MIAAAVAFVFACGLTALFVVLDWRACSQRPDLYGEAGKYGRRSGSIWMLPAVACGFVAYLLYRAAFRG